MNAESVEQRLSEGVRQFLAEARAAVLVTIGEDGLPEAVPVWYDLDEGGFLYVSTTRDRAIYRNVFARPNVLLIVDEQAPSYRCVVVRAAVDVLSGNIEERTRCIAVRYLGRDAGSTYADEMLKGDRVLLRLTPVQVQSWGV